MVVAVRDDLGMMQQLGAILPGQSVPWPFRAGFGSETGLGSQA
jgi:hypothetical protein